MDSNTSADIYQATAENLPHIYYETDRSGKLLFLNRQGYTVFHYTPEDMQPGLSFHDLVAPQDRQKSADDFDRLLSGALFLGAEYTFQTKIATTFSGFIYPQLTTEDNKITGARGFLFETDEQQRLNNRLTFEQRRTRDYLELSATLLLRRDMDGKVIEINKKGCELLEDSEEEILGKDWIDSFVHRESQAQAHAVFQQMINGKIEPNRESTGLRLITKNGKEIITNWRNRLVKTRAGEIIGVMSSGEDVTERVRLETELKESEEKYRSIFNESQAGIVIIDAETGRIAECNREFENQTGRKSDELNRMKIWEILPERLADVVKKAFEKLPPGAISGISKTEYLKPNGQITPIEFVSRAITIAGKRYKLSTTCDISSRVEAEKQLRESEEKFAKIFCVSPDPIIISNLKTDLITDVNEIALKISGYTRDELIGHSAAELGFWKNLADRDRILSILRQSGAVNSEELAFRTKNGQLRTFLYAARMIEQGGVTFLLSVLTDITERKQVETALLESEERFSIAFHSSPYMQLITNLEKGVYCEVNKIYCDATGYTREEIINHSHNEINLWVDREEAEQFLRRLLANQTAWGEHRFRMKNGEIRTWLCSAASIKLHGDQCMLATASDITERIRAEEDLKLLYEQEIYLRRQLEKEMKRRAEFTRALVHELKTPLTPIVASSDSLVEIIQEEPLKSMAVNVNRGALNLNKRIDELLELARSELKILQVSPEALNIEKLMQHIVSEMGPMAAKQRHELKLDIPEPLPFIEADPERIRQVITNLLTNSLKFTPAGGEITLRGSADEKRITIEVQDNGRGLTEGELERLFQPYYRKERDRDHLSGLGLGLALCKTLVELHHGEIWARSKPGEGSTFGFWLPIRPFL